MHQKFDNRRLKWWPTLQDYNEAIQTPRVCLRDLELSESLPYTGALGLPRAITGAFASVYRMHREDKDYALRLFLNDIEDRAERYHLIGDYVQHDDLVYTVTFDFLSEGIQIHNQWLPVVKMDWVDGEHLDEYIIANLTNSAKLAELSDSFIKMMKELQDAGIAHGDLQHGNIIVQGTELRLVDYDGMYVPKMHGMTAREVGHPNYQHPKRAAHHFGPYLDNFSAWIIYASIKALQLDPGLFEQLNGGDDCLLFKDADLKNPLESSVFAAFEKHENNELRNLSRYLRAQLEKDVDQVPYLESSFPEIDEHQITLIPESVSTKKESPTIARPKHADWLKTENLQNLFKATKGGSLIQLNESEHRASLIASGKQYLDSAWIKPTTRDFLRSQRKFDPQRKPLPPELQTNKLPRKVWFDNRRGESSPLAYQLLMVFNPIVWFVVLGLIPFFSGGAKSIDWPRLSIWLVLTLLIERVIWSEPLRHRRFARFGTPAVASIDKILQSADEATVTISYEIDGIDHTKEMRFFYREETSLVLGSTEVILCNPKSLKDVVFYRFCKYKVSTKQF